MTKSSLAVIENAKLHSHHWRWTCEYGMSLPPGCWERSLAVLIQANPFNHDCLTEIHWTKPPENNHSHHPMIIYPTKKKSMIRWRQSTAPMLTWFKTLSPIKAQTVTCISPSIISLTSFDRVFSLVYHMHVNEKMINGIQPRLISIVGPLPQSNLLDQDTSLIRVIITFYWNTVNCHKLTSLSTVFNATMNIALIRIIWTTNT